MEVKINISKHEVKETKIGPKHFVYDGEKKYEFFETKRDGSPTMAYHQWKKFGLDAGIRVQAVVEEKKTSFMGKTGKEIPITRRTILFFKGDEHNVPYQQDVPKADASAIEALEKRVLTLENHVFGLLDFDES